MKNDGKINESMNPNSRARVIFDLCKTSFIDSSQENIVSLALSSEVWTCCQLQNSTPAGGKNSQEH